ncbi:hypothetical protein CASFOL_014996 [Castilleja foliolosa]|uniref:Uncharacterized protein n=1 Tax=Castilleja foliolosa TaxID=1961234 RepID=A0ABD3DCV4_9LAMI
MGSGGGRVLNFDSGRRRFRAVIHDGKRAWWFRRRGRETVVLVVRARGGISPSPPMKGWPFVVGVLVAIGGDEGEDGGGGRRWETAERGQLRRGPSLNDEDYWHGQTTGNGSAWLRRR